MKDESKSKPRKTRVHRVLFDRDSPFKPKTVESKVAYKRKSKHNKPLTDDAEQRIINLLNIKGCAMKIVDLKTINLEMVSTQDLENLYAAIGMELQERDMGKRYKFEELERAWNELTNTAGKTKSIFSA